MRLAPATGSDRKAEAVRPRPPTKKSIDPGPCPPVDFTSNPIVRSPFRCPQGPSPITIGRPVGPDDSVSGGYASAGTQGGSGEPPQ